MEAKHKMTYEEALKIYFEMSDEQREAVKIISLKVSSATFKRIKNAIDGEIASIRDAAK